jgi:hypothetical protein
MATPGVGQDIDALCGKCGQVWHVVMAKMGERIAKVVCKRCGGHHRYRSEVPGAAEAGPGSEPRRPARSATRPPVAPPPRAVPTFDPAIPPRRYAATELYAAGDRVSHPTFGVGVVATFPGPGKVEVIFPAGARVLACAKAMSTLTRPVAVVGIPVSDRPPTAK